MSLEQIGYGGVGGLIIAALSILGIHKRIDKKQDKGICDAVHKGIDTGFCGFTKALQDQKEHIEYIRQRIDTIANGRVEK
jgi:hypothetical protein